MADIQDRIGQILGSDSARALAGNAFNEALKALTTQRSSNGASEENASPSGGGGSSRGGLSGMRGMAAGAGAAAAAPLAAKGIGKLIRGNGAGALLGGSKKLVEDGPKKLAEEATSKLGDTVEGKLKEKVEDAGGPSGILKDTVKNALPFGGGGGGGGGKQDAEGVGKGRRMPIQQSIDIALPIETIYNQWTQFEEWPKFMHRVTRASQEDACKVNFAVKIWGKTKEFTAEIETQRPDDRIKWKTTQGMNHTGVVTFRELAPNITRVMLSFDVAPGSLIEKYARGARYVKRAARADLHRFAAFIEMLEHESGAWRGVIEDGELVEDHDPSYDEERQYADADELVHGRGSEEDEEEDEDSDEEQDSDSDEDEDESSGHNGGEPQQRTQRRRTPSRGTEQPGRSRQSNGSSQAQSRSGSSSRSPGRSGSSSRSSGSRSSGSRSSGGRSSGGSSSGGSSSRSSSSRSGGNGSSRSSGRSSSGSSGGRTSGSGSSSGRSSSRATSGRSSGGSGSSRGSSSGSASSGRTRSRSSSGSSRSSSSQRQGRQGSRSSRRS